MVLLEDFRTHTFPISAEGGCLSLTSLYNGLTKEAILGDLEENLAKVRKIDNPVRRSRLSNLYFATKTYVENAYEDGTTVASIYFVVGAGEGVAEYRLKPRERQVLQEFHIRNVLNYTDDVESGGIAFRIAYFTTMFDGTDFFYALEIDARKDFVLQKYDAVKNKVVRSGRVTVLKDDIERIVRQEEGYKKLLFIFGASLPAKAYEGIPGPYRVLEGSGSYGRDALNELWSQEMMRENHRLLETRLREMTREEKMDLYFFGKLPEIREAIEAYSLKELFIEGKKLKKLQEQLGPEYFNFQIYPIEKLETGDVGDRFLQEYRGLMGIKYY